MTPVRQNRSLAYMKRLLTLLCGLTTLLVACGGDSDTVPRSEVVRLCGELDGVEPVDPVVVGQYPVERAGGGTGSCPMFAPIPCTRPFADYIAVCGDGCQPTTAVTPDGDTWLVGCNVDLTGVGCSDPDFESVECARDPYEGNPYWFTFRECLHPFLPYSACWRGCDGAPLGESAGWCP